MLQRPHRRFVVPLLGARLAQDYVQLRGVALSRQEPGEDRLGLPLASTAREGEAVGEEQRGIGLALGVVSQEIGGLLVGFDLEPGHGQHAAQVGVPGGGGERPGKGSGRLVEPLGVEVGHPQGVLEPGQVGLRPDGRLEELGRLREPPRLRLQDAQVEVGAGHRRLDPAPDLPPQRRAEPGNGPALRRAVRAFSRHGSAAERLLGLVRATLGQVERPHQRPAADQSGPVPALGEIALVLAKAGLGFGEGLLEARGGFGRSLGPRERGQEDGEEQGQDGGAGGGPTRRRGHGDPEILS